jgi:branched-chain amino acid transport system ATP-binding protein
VTAASAPVLLRTTDLAVSFGGVNALDGVDLVVPTGQLVGLIGPNGAGKTTTIDALTGFVAARGRIELAGEDITDWSPDRRARAGLVRTWQSLELFDDLTVEENCRVAAEPPSLRRAVRDVFLPGRAAIADDVAWAMDLVGISAVAGRHPDELSLGQRKLAGVARALAARPRLVLLDEPAAGLDTDESTVLGAVLRRLIDEGLTVLLVDHDMGLVLSVCDTIHVLDFGRFIAHGSPAAIRADPRVVAAYLGGTADDAAAERLGHS